jgi:hypothetical protein
MPDRNALEAYGWSQDISDEDILKSLLALNVERGPGTERAPRLPPTKKAAALSGTGQRTLLSVTASDVDRSASQAPLPPRR